MEENEAERPPIYALATWQRFLIAFAIGLPTTMMFPFALIPTPIWWQWYTPITILLLALVLSIARDPLARERRLRERQLVNSLLTVVLLMVAYVVFVFVMAHLYIITAFIAYIVVPLMVGLVGSFVAVAGRTKGFGMFCGAFAWLGAAVANIIATVINAQIVVNDPDFAKYFPTLKGGNLIGTVLMFFIVFHVAGLTVALWGGQLGWRLRKRLLGEQAVRVEGGLAS